MKLYYSPLSPFVRKVLVAAHELGLADRIESVSVSTTPVKPSEQVLADNPLGKIPALVVEDGPPLFDSRVIIEYLDAVGGQKLFPASGAARWAALRRQALADGLMDAAILIRYERGFRPEPLHFGPWIDGQYVKLRRAVEALEAEAEQLGTGPTPTVGDIAVACALGYLDFRFPEEGWREGRERLAAFYARFAERPSMQATQPPAA